MNRDEVIRSAWDWIVRTHGPSSANLRILTDDVVLVRGQWHVPYDATDDVLVPLPAVEVPDDGGEPRAYVPTPPSPWKHGVPRGQRGPGLSIVDPEWDLETFGHLGVPKVAILGWVREEGSDEFRRNAAHTPGPGGRGWPLPQTPADKIFSYYQCGWLEEDARFVSGVVDVVVCTTDQIGQDDDGHTWLATYSSDRLLPPGTRRWREVSVRELLTTTTADEVRVNPGHDWQTSLKRPIPLDRWPAPFPLPAPAERHEDGGPALVERVDEARAHCLSFTAEEREILAECLRWQESGQQGPPPRGVQQSWDANGARVWQAPTFGKAAGLPATQQNGWPWLAGLLAGFALGDNPYEATLFKLIDDVVRAVAQGSPAFRADHSWLPRREGWLPNTQEPVRVVRAIVAGLGAGNPVVRGVGWDDEISPVIARAVSREAFSRAPHYILQELGMPEPDTGTPWGFAVRIVSSLGNHPPTALAAAAFDPLVEALTGALLGAWHGVAGLPVGPQHDLAECVATEAFLAFDPKYSPAETTHPGLPPISDAMRAEAAKNPGGWIYCADPDIDPRYIQGAPLFTLLGAYEVGPDGRFTGGTWVNDEYKPSPRRLGLPEPLCEFEVVLNYVTAGWLPYEAVMSAALESQLLAQPGPDGNLAIARDVNGNGVLALYSSPRHLPPGDYRPGGITLKDVLSVLPGVQVLVNPGGAVGVDFKGDDLVAMFTGRPG
ncbi:hypothetical protein OG205_39000 [Lentzea sp. NBC_00516]|uniref:hypothetical protein n=1 Tax=Lentzea sp. NBC_00516 TaxID=2903582 RepID=UPI002E801EA0|nr:hypothetical protein [Lentzea sp. NBC_00516]WUD23984.1 hypothetical protein OG205_39000 [Lentzea sp. NBC_00516]